MFNLPTVVLGRGFINNPAFIAGAMNKQLLIDSLSKVVTVTETSDAAQEIISGKMHEMKKKEPKVVKNTRKKKGKTAANKQLIAIALDTARRAGKKVPRKR